MYKLYQNLFRRKKSETYNIYFCCSYTNKFFYIFELIQKIFFLFNKIFLLKDYNGVLIFI